VMSEVDVQEANETNEVERNNEQSYLGEELVTELMPVAYKRTAPNSLILDQCQLRLEDGQWSEPMEVWRAQRIIRERLGMRQVFHNGNLQRYFWIHEDHPCNHSPVELRFTFVIKDVPETETYLVFEDA